MLLEAIKAFEAALDVKVFEDLVDDLSVQSLLFILVFSDLMKLIEALLDQLVSLRVVL